MLCLTCIIALYALWYDSETRAVSSEASALRACEMSAWASAKLCECTYESARARPYGSASSPSTRRAAPFKGHAHTEASCHAHARIESTRPRAHAHAFYLCQGFLLYVRESAWDYKYRSVGRHCDRFVKPPSGAARGEHVSPRGWRRRSRTRTSPCACPRKSAPSAPI